jgi:hypothetical protein
MVDDMVPAHNPTPIQGSAPSRWGQLATGRGESVTLASAMNVQPRDLHLLGAHRFRAGTHPPTILFSPDPVVQRLLGSPQDLRRGSHALTPPFTSRTVLSLNSSMSRALVAFVTSVLLA